MEDPRGAPGCRAAEEQRASEEKQECNEPAKGRRMRMFDSMGIQTVITRMDMISKGVVNGTNI